MKWPMRGTATGQDVSFRDYPYPYSAMLSICSDLDETESADQYFEIAEFLNTENSTKSGRGVNLEVGNTIYFDMPGDQFSYWNASVSERRRIHSLIRSGHIDCFHSFGDNATTRGDAGRALNTLDSDGCKIECWVDHAQASTNLGTDIMQGTGDNPGSDAYHSDLLYAHGVRFVWLGRVTSIIGQNTRRGYCSNYYSANVVQSLKTILKDLAKAVAGRLGSSKYSLHSGNALIRPRTLSSGQVVVEFMRCNPHWNGVSAGDTADGIAEILTERVLEALCERRGASVLYTHLGKRTVKSRAFSEDTVAAFRRLKRYSVSGRILVTTTRRLLGYFLLRELLEHRREVRQGREEIHLSTHRLPPRHAPWEMHGLTMYVSDPSRVRVIADSRRELEFIVNEADETGRPSVSVPWPALIFPCHD